MRLTKTDLKKQRDALARYERYLPTLQLKKCQLQQELERLRARSATTHQHLEDARRRFAPWVPLLAEEVGLEDLLVLTRVQARVDNVAGVDIPVFVEIHFRKQAYDLFVLPLWVDSALEQLELILRLEAEWTLQLIGQERLERELRRTAQRVNLFEQVKIPESRQWIRRISVHLSDQQTAAFGWALLAKRKLELAT